MKSTIELVLAISTFAYQTNNILDKLFTFYIKNKFIQIVRQNKSITSIISKFEKVYINF